MPHLTHAVRFHPSVVTDVMYLPSLSTELKTAQFYSADEIGVFHSYWRQAAMKNSMNRQLEKQQVASARAQVTRILTKQLESRLPVCQTPLSPQVHPIPVSPVTNRNKLVTPPPTSQEADPSAFSPYPASEKRVRTPVTTKRLYIDAKMANMHRIDEEHPYPKLPFPSIPNKRRRIASPWVDPPRKKICG